jgi:hypothetical protein
VDPAVLQAGEKQGLEYIRPGLHRPTDLYYVEINLGWSLLKISMDFQVNLGHLEFYDNYYGAIA